MSGAWMMLVALMLGFLAGGLTVIGAIKNEAESGLITFSGKAYRVTEVIEGADHHPPGA